MRKRRRGRPLHLHIHFVLFLRPVLPSSFLPLALSVTDSEHARSLVIYDLFFCYSAKGCISLLSAPWTIYRLLHPGLNNLSHLGSCIANYACFDTDIKGSQVCWVAQLPGLTPMPLGCFVLHFSLRLDAEGQKKKIPLHLMLKRTETLDDVNNWVLFKSELLLSNER